MSNTLGRLFRITIFGESHGSRVGCVVDGLPPGRMLDQDLMDLRLGQRKPKSNTLTTSRHESDYYTISSGFFNERTTGTPLCVTFENNQIRSEDYDSHRFVFRPGHADYTGYEKFHGFNDYRGGGHFSARLTAPVVFAGTLAEQMLKEMGIEIHVLIQKIGGKTAPAIETLSAPDLQKIQLKAYAIQDSMEKVFLEMIEEVKASGDSIGGVVSVLVSGMDAGIGEPYFDSLESELSKAVFSIPGVKGIEFGTGFGVTDLLGSEANDVFYKEPSGAIRTRTNHNGGVNGGISNGMPLVFRCAFKPTSSIGKAQMTLDFESMALTEHSIIGRHDPCIALRAPAVVRAMTAIVLYDLILVKRGIYGDV